MSVPLQPDLADGRYVVHWNNVSDEDGDPAEGAFSFYVNYEPNAVDLENDEQLGQIGAEETPASNDTPAAEDTPATSETPAGSDGTPVASPTAGDDGEERQQYQRDPHRGCCHRGRGRSRRRRLPVPARRGT